MHRQDVTHGPHTPQHEEARLINPSENANNQRFVARLRQEVEAWLQDGTVTAEQAQAILARYPAYVPGYEASRRRQSLVVGLSILGAILIGLSVITFFAANWNEISRGVKLGSLFVGMALSYGSGYYLWNRAGYGAYAVALVLLGCIIYGAGVHLIGQIYHIDVDNPNLSMFWFLGVAPLAYVTRSRPVMVLAIVVFLAAVGFRLVPWLEEVSGSSTALLTSQEVSRSSAVILSAALYLSLAAFLYAIGRAKGLFKGWESIGGLFQAFGLLVGFGALYLLTFHDLFFRDGNANRVAFGYWALAYGASVIALALMAGLAWLRVRRGDRSTMELVEVALFAALLAAVHVAARVDVEWQPLYPIVFNGLFALSALGLMASGYLQEHEGRINLSLALIALYVITRYFEYSRSLFDSSLMFFGAGVILLAGGFLLERGRRKMLASMHVREGEE